MEFVDPVVTGGVFGAIIGLLRVIERQVDRKNGNTGFSAEDRERLKRISGVDGEGRPLTYFPRQEFRELTSAIKESTKETQELCRAIKERNGG